MEEHIILVDENDNPIGEEEKLKAHLEGKRHRCISIFIFNSKGELMLQKRALGKYHSGGLWSNTVCGHQRPGEGTISACHRRLKFEMGFDCEMQEAFVFEYHAELDKGITEHEIDHVCFGNYEGSPVPNSDEVGDWKWMDMNELAEDIEKDPGRYTFWLKVALSKVLHNRGKVGVN